MGEAKAIQDWKTPLTEAELVYGKHLDSQRKYSYSVTVRPIDKKGRYTGEDYTYTVKPEVKTAEN